MNVRASCNSSQPSDPRAEQGGPNASGASYGGVDVNGKSKAELIDEAHRAGADATPRMTKAQIARTLQSSNDSATRKARR